MGSLLWREALERERWRQERLLIDEGVKVEAPIYYGRLSKSRTYTMTFDGHGAMGRAVLVPCRAVVTGLQDLLAEAQSLWGAECSTAKAGSVGASWGCIGALFREGEATKRLRAEWSRWFRQSGAVAVAAVSPEGLLGVPWPTDAEESDVEVILATSTVPATPRATAQQIADAWIANGGEEYFFRNVEHGIRTPDDSAIWVRMNERRAPWLGRADWARAIRELEIGGRQRAERTQRDFYVVVHHQRDESQPWVNAWLDDQRIEAIQTTNEIGALCRQAKDRGERVFVHRCGWEACPPVVCCSAEVEDVGKIDGSTVLVRFTSAKPLELRPPVSPAKGQNFYLA